MQTRYLLVTFLLFLTACSTSTNNTVTANAVADIPTPTEANMASTDCPVVIATLQQELTVYQQEQKTKELELGKKLREARATKDENTLTALNVDIDELSQRVRELRKTLIPTLETQITIKQKSCA